MPSSSKLVSIPDSFTQWQKAAKKKGLEDVSVYKLLSHDSASKIGEEQYLTLRSIWAQESGLDEWGFSELARAKQWLEGRSDWADYLLHLPKFPISKPGIPLVPIPELGSFSGTLYELRQIERTKQVAQEKVNFTPIARRLRSSTAQGSRLDESPSARARARNLTTTMAGLNLDDDDEGVRTTPSPPDSPESNRKRSPSPWKVPKSLTRELYPDVEDEQIVNSFLLSLCGSLTFHVPEICTVWSPRRKAFNFGNDVLFQARTDGHLFLWNPDQENPMSEMIVEVKPTNRISNDHIIYQVTAQMAAWIFAEPDTDKKAPVHR